MDCSVPQTGRSYKFSRKARVRESKPESVHDRVGKFREAYSSPPIKLSFVQPRERSLSFSPSKSQVRLSQRGDDISEVSSVSFDLAHGEAAVGSVASIIQEYKTARDSMRQSENRAGGDMLSPHRLAKAASEVIFACRSPGCSKGFRFAGDLYAHECRDHEQNGSQPRAIRIPFDKTLHQQRASTTASRRRPTEVSPGPRPAVPISRPRTAGVTVEVLQQGRKWEEGQLMLSWANHRATLDDYIQKLDRELEKTRDRLPMGPLALKAKRMALAADEED